MMNENPKMYLDREAKEDVRYNTLDLDLVLEVLEADLADFTLPTDTLAEEEVGPKQPEIEDLPPGPVLLSLQQPVSPAPEFHAVANGFPPGPTYYSPDEERFGPQQPEIEDLPPGPVLLSLQQPVLPAPEFHAVANGFPLGPTYYSPDEERCGPQQSQTDCYMNLGADQFSPQQTVMPALASPIYQPPTVMQQNYMYCQPDPFNHSQVNNMPVMSLPQGQRTNMAPLGYMNGKMVYGVPAYAVPPDTFDAPEVKAPTPQRRKFYRKPDDESKPYVKKPPNAFMIFRMEKRPGVVAEFQNPDCAAVNRIIGQRWKSLPKEEQAKYYKHADTERNLHSQLFPEWSAVDNYGLKRKRIRRKGPAVPKDSS